MEMKTSETVTANETEVEVEVEGEGESPNETETENDLEARVAELEDELSRTRRALKKANREAAQRRHQLKESPPATEETEELEKYRKRVDELEAEVNRRTREVREERQRQQVLQVANQMGFEFPEDLMRLGDIEFDPDEEKLDEDDIKAAAKALARKRPGLIKKNSIPPDLDSQRRGGRDDALTIDEEEVARTFGIRNYS